MSERLQALGVRIDSENWWFRDLECDGAVRRLEAPDSPISVRA